MITLGKEVEDAISGFKGIAVARTVWLNGCVRIAIQPKIDGDGKYVEEVWIDEGQLVELEEEVAPEDEVREIEKEPSGGPVLTPKRHNDFRGRQVSRPFVAQRSLEEKQRGT